MSLRSISVTLYFIIVLLSGKYSFAQDTLIVANNYKFKIGIKNFVEGSGDFSVAPVANLVYSTGIQVIYKLGNTKSSLESGIYFLSRARQESYVNIYYSIAVLKHGNIHIPVNYRLDTKIIYIAAGVYADYLVYRYSINKDILLHDPYYQPDRKLNLGFNLAAGIEKPFSKAFSIFCEGEFSQNFTNAKEGYGFFRFQYNRGGTFTNYGIAFGVNYKILK